MKNNGLNENTVVIFTSDNGAAVGKSEPLSGKKGSTWEGGMRVPTVIRWPGKIPAGRDNAELMTAMDLLPTFAKLAGAEIPKDRVLDGRDISDVLMHHAKTPHGAFFITADDISQEDLGCYGHPTIKTPHIDGLAANGMRFDNAYLTASSCSPSRCSIITGRYPHNTGAPELHVPLPEEQIRFPELLRKSGYYTVLAGKNHMFGNADRAFDMITRGGEPGGSSD